MCLSNNNIEHYAKKRDTGITKPPDVFLPALHAGPKSILFIDERGAPRNTTGHPQLACVLGSADENAGEDGRNS
jgi:hypothetical protein